MPTRQAKSNHLLVTYPDSKVHGTNIGSIWGRKGPGGPRVGLMNFAICVASDTTLLPLLR